MHETDYNASNNLKLEDAGNSDNTVVQYHCLNENNDTDNCYAWGKKINKM